LKLIVFNLHSKAQKRSKRKGRGGSHSRASIFKTSQSHYVVGFLVCIQFSTC